MLTGTIQEQKAEQVFSEDQEEEEQNLDEPESEEDIIEKIIKRDGLSNTASYWPGNDSLPAGEDGSYKTAINRRIQGQEPLYAEALPSAQNHVGPEVYTLPMPDNVLFDRFFQSFLKAERKKTMEHIFEKAVLYRGYIASRIQERSLPPELLYLPVIESSFAIKAVSVTGARGLWQFMPGTARYMGLAINDWVDERQDFWKSTNAALAKLDSDEKFLGDWYLALAAYHCGTGRVMQAIKRSKNGSHDYWELCAQGLLPRATVYYVPSFLAAVKIATYPGRYGFPLTWEQSPDWQTIELDRMIDLEILANLTNMPFDLLKAGNAELQSYFTPPTSSKYTLKIPAPYVEKVQACLQDAKINLVRYDYYVIRSGDTIYGLAKRYGIKEELIRKANPQIKPTALRIGAKVKIPIPAGAKIPVQKPAPKPQYVNSPFTKEYTVTKGDTLWSIAKLFGITLEELVAKNNISAGKVIRIGEKLKVPAALKNVNSPGNEG